MTGRQYGTLGIAGVGACVLALIGLHVLDRDLSVVEETISAYALGNYGRLERGSDIAFGVGTIGIALGLRETLTSGKRATASWVLMLIAGLGFVVSGLFTTDPTGVAESTSSGAIHGTASFVSVLSFLISSWMLRGVFACDSRHEHLARAQSWFAVLLTVALLLLFALFPLGLVGLIQRISFVVLASWLFVLAANLRQVKATRHAS